MSLTRADRSDLASSSSSIPSRSMTDRPGTTSASSPREIVWRGDVTTTDGGSSSRMSTGG